jgi:hypothetical protein
VFDSFVAVKALANNDATLHHDGADQRVWLYLTFAFGGKGKRAIKKILIALAATRTFTEKKRADDHNELKSA